jgi:large subunit ribosomal protein L4e
LKVYVNDLSGKHSGQVELPSVFDSPLRPDLVKRVYWILNSHHLQPKGRDPMAGMKTSAETSNPPTGHGISRIPRVKGDRYSRSGLAGGVASIVKGRLAHPPKSEKVIYLKVNKKEKRRALESAVAYTANSEAVVNRGHRVKGLKLPLVVSDDIERVSKTSELDSFLTKMGLEEELSRLQRSVKRQTGHRRLRGRPYRLSTGPLIVISNDRGVSKVADSIPGVNVVNAESLSLLDLAPGGVPGRLTLWSESSLGILEPKKEVAKVAA